MFPKAHYLTLLNNTIKILKLVGKFNCILPSENWYMTFLKLNFLLGWNEKDDRSQKSPEYITVFGACLRRHDILNWTCMLLTFIEFIVQFQIRAEISQTCFEGVG